MRVMSAAFEVRVPLLNPNERDAQLVALHVSEGASISANDLICTLETTKSTADVAADRDGYVVGIRAEVGDRVVAGDVLCWLAGDPDWKPPAAEAAASIKTASGVKLRITEPAIALAEELGVDLDALPGDEWITADIVRRYAQQEAPLEVPDLEIDSKSLVVYGGGGHGKALIDLIRVLGTYTIVGILDDGMNPGDQVMGVPILGGAEMLDPLKARGLGRAVNAVGGIGDVQSRVRVFERLRQADYVCPVLVHPTAFVEVSAKLADGVQVFPHAYIGSDAQIGFGAIVNTAAVVSHDCRLADYANVAPGALLAGGVEIGAGALIGMGTTINLNVTVGDGARVGNSSVIKADVPGAGIVRAGTIWPAPQPGG
jgi:acetyltransferase EpsM